MAYRLAAPGKKPRLRCQRGFVQALPAMPTLLYGLQYLRQAGAKVLLIKMLQLAMLA